MRRIFYKISYKGWLGEVMNKTSFEFLFLINLKDFDKKGRLRGGWYSRVTS